MKRKIQILLIFMILILFLVFPKSVGEGAKKGILLWFRSVLPALLPFMIFSIVLVKRNVTDLIGRLAYPLFHRMFGLSMAGCFPVVIGLLSGYPLGAKTISDLFCGKKITRSEAEFLLIFCNNASPMFLLQYVGLRCLGLKNPLSVLVIIILSAMISAFVYKLWKFSFGCGKKWNFSDYSRDGVRRADSNKSMVQKQSLIVVLDESILDAFVTMTKVGGYIIIFSILANLLHHVVLLPETVRAILIGILEITTGGDAVYRMNANVVFKNAVLTAVCAFGGCSGMAQTFSVMNGSGLSKKKYVLAKVVQMIVVFLVSLTYYSIC